MRIKRTRPVFKPFGPVLEKVQSLLKPQAPRKSIREKKETGNNRREKGKGEQIDIQA